MTRRLLRESEKFKTNHNIDESSIFYGLKNISCVVSKLYDFGNDTMCLQDVIITYGDVLQLEMCITYPYDFPFSCPIWSLKKYEIKYHMIKENINSIQLIDYYKYILFNHNEEYECAWSPAIHMEKDILYFLSRIIHFDELFLNPFENNNEICIYFKNHILEEIIKKVWHPTRFYLWKNYDDEIEGL